MDGSPLSWIDRIFVINLDRSKERWETCLKQIKKYNLPAERFAAVEGKALTAEDRAKYVHPVCDNLLCTAGMIGCGISHYLLLKKTVEENIGCVLILEDDFVWLDRTTELLNRIRDFDKGIVKLVSIDSNIESYDRLCADPKLGPEPVAFPFSTGAYIMRQREARIIYEHFDKIMYHVDVQFSVICKQYNVPMYLYQCMLQAGFDSSTLSSNDTLLSQLIPMSEKAKWVMKEPFIAPFGYSIHLFLLISVLLIAVGIALYIRASKVMGTIVFVLGLIDFCIYVTKI